MTTASATPAPTPLDLRTVLRWTGRVLVGVWAAFWGWFNVASLVSEVGELGVGAWINHGLLAVLVVGLTVLAYVKPRIGGALLLVLTAGMGFLFRGAQPLVLAMLLLPPALGGLLTLATIRRG